MTQVQNPMQNFIARLRRLDSKLTKVTPYWWDNSLAKSPGASQQAVLSMAKYLNLDIKSVLDSQAELKFKDMSCCYRKAGNKAINDLLVATGLVYSASRTAAKMVKHSYTNFSDASVIRRQILESGKPYVDLRSLVDYCWKHGVPVLFLPNLPASKKMDAVVQEVNGRPVIAITKKHKHESMLLFLLAHEMGHVFCGHLESGQVIIDESVRESDEVDQQESEANDFALSLLTGKSDTRFHSGGVRLTGQQLAEIAELTGKEKHIDPGHIALNWAYTTQNWGVAYNALNILYPKLTWQDDLKEMFLENVDQFEVDEDELDYLFNLMKIEG
ncbi:ImmA/IrrE family metallo-endopeptidase [Vibrio alginolyticus]|nr:ImmA/IrrE family metallo-endopeptidase [Vibrio alginolyticus]